MSYSLRLGLDLTRTVPPRSRSRAAITLLRDSDQPAESERVNYLDNKALCNADAN